MEARWVSSLFNRHADALRSRHGDRVWRLGLDGGFSCPNRDAAAGRGGCSFCARDGSRAPYLPGPGASLAVQAEAGASFLRRRYGARLFFLYFQAFSSTYAPERVLRERYDEAIGAVRALLGRGAVPSASRGEELRGLVVSTRPDCVDASTAELLGSYAETGLEVWVELGLQSARDRTLRAIGRGHGFAEYARATELLAGRGLRIAAHLVLGLHDEGRDDMLETVRAAVALGLDGVKFHDLRVLEGTRLASEYRAGEFAPLHPSRLPGLLADCLEELDPSCEVMRLCADTPPGSTIAPRAIPDKEAVYRAVEDELAARGSRQGSRLTTLAKPSDMGYTHRRDAM
jgi:uncharacterized protein